jgi:hypothetical protein
MDVKKPVLCLTMKQLALIHHEISGLIHPFKIRFINTRYSFGQKFETFHFQQNA